MTRDEIMRMAREAGFVLYDMHETDGQDLGETVEADDWAALERFAELVTEKERAARIEAQQRLADMQELAAKAGLAHRMAVQRCVHAAVAEAVAAEREACAKACESSANGFGEETLWAAGYVQGVRDVADGIRARGTPRHNNGEHDAI